MLNISKEQMKAFAEIEAKKFLDRALLHLARCFPRENKIAGETELRKLVEYAMQRSAAYGVVVERDVLKYLDMMLVFGCDYDVDKRFPWAGEILRTRNSPEVKIAVLTETAKKHVK